MDGRDQFRSDDGDFDQSIFIAPLSRFRCSKSIGICLTAKPWWMSARAFPTRQFGDRVIDRDWVVAVPRAARAEIGLHAVDNLGAQSKTRPALISAAVACSPAAPD